MVSGELENLCGKFRRRLCGRLWQAGLCRLLSGGLLALALLLALDWWQHFGLLSRALILLVWLAGLAATAWWTMLLPLRRSWPDDEILGYIDSVSPSGRGMLLELYQLRHGKEIQEAETAVGKQLLQEAVETLEKDVHEATITHAFQTRRLSRWLRLAGTVTALFMIGAFALRTYFSVGCERFFNPFSTRRWPSLTVITLQEPQNGWTIPQLEPFTVRGVATGVIPASFTLNYRMQGTGNWLKEKVPLGDGGALQYTFPLVREPVTFYIAGGDYTTDTYRIDIIARPYLKKIVASYAYPDYAGLPDKVEESGQLAGLEGTSVALAFESSMPLRKAMFALQTKSGAQTEELPLISETAFQKKLLLTSDASYSVELYEKHGFREARPEHYEIRVIPYDPPEVELLSPGRDLVATRQATVHAAFRARDTYGLKKVEFLYQVDEGPETPLSDRITGPLAPNGKTLEARFAWDLRKMNFPKTAVVRYFVRATDVNPTGRGVTATTKFQVKLVKPSEFHFEVFERAKQIEAEARVAWESQYAAWELGGTWASKAVDKEDDPVWQELLEKQELAIRAAKAIESYLREIIEQYEQNDLRPDFMAARLGVITALLRRVTETEHPAIWAGLEKARPKTDADAGRIQALRAGALGLSGTDSQFPNDRKLVSVPEIQKLATLYLERVLTRLFDWRDLQTALIRSTMLHEEQEEVLAQTSALGPKTLGWKIEDLADDVQDRLLTLGKRQGTLFDVETELEKELEFQMYRAEKQRRKSIVLPLATAYHGLREKRVNDNLKTAAKSIGENQLLPIVQNQKAALEALSLVRGGLLYAGQNLDPEDAAAPTLALLPSKLLIDIEPKAQAPESAASEEPATASLLPQGVIERNLNLGSDPLTDAITATWEAQDQVRGRTRYFAENSSPQEMPRYLDRKLGIMLEKQDQAIAAADRALKAAGDATPVMDVLDGVRRELAQSRQLLAARQVGPAVQQLQTDCLDALDDLRRVCWPLLKTTKDLAEDNKSHGGKDAFNRKFVLQDKDVDQAVALSAALAHALVRQRDVFRAVARFAKFPQEAPEFAAMEKANRTQAAESQAGVASSLLETRAKIAALSPDAAARVQAAGFDKILALKLSTRAAEIRGAATDKELAGSFQEVISLLDQTLSNLKNLLEERVAPPLAAKAEDTKEAPKLTLEEWERRRSPATLREKLKADKSLPPEVRDIMLNALNKEFPPQYKEILASYYASFIGEEKEAAK